MLLISNVPVSSSRISNVLHTANTAVCNLQCENRIRRRVQQGLEKNILKQINIIFFSEKNTLSTDAIELFGKFLFGPLALQKIGFKIFFGISNFPIFLLLSLDSGAETLGGLFHVRLFMSRLKNGMVLYGKPLLS